VQNSCIEKACIQAPDIQFEPSGTLNGLEQLINSMLQSGVQSLLILSCADNGFTQSSLSPFLKKLPVPVCGGLFPKIIHEGKIYGHGSIVIGFDHTLDIHTIRNINEWIPPRQLCSLDFFDKKQKAFLLIFVDGLASGIEAFLDEAYDRIGGHFSVVGGGAGQQYFKHLPCIISNDGLLENSAQAVLMPRRLCYDVKHGWEMAAGPFLVTSSDKNRIHTLNYQPAYQLYREALEGLGAQKFADTPFFQISKTYPLGMERLDAEVIVRDPIACEENSLICVGEVPEFSKVYILKGNVRSLTGAAREAVSTARRECRHSMSFMLLWDCISRYLFLNDQFNSEMSAIVEEMPDHIPMIGVLTIGEVVSSRMGSVFLYNKSIVVTFVE
jgi:hypothetical protein